MELECRNLQPYRYRCGLGLNTKWYLDFRSSFVTCIKKYILTLTWYTHTGPCINETMKHLHCLWYTLIFFYSVLFFPTVIFTKLILSRSNGLKDIRFNDLGPKPWDSLLLVFLSVVSYFGYIPQQWSLWLFLKSIT